MSRGQGKRLSKAEKNDLAEKALVMSIKGYPVTRISKDLEVAWNTANALIEYALEKRDIDEDAEREKSLAHHRGIIRWCWEQLEDDELGKFAQNRPAYINRIQHSQSEIDRLNNVTPPVRTEQVIDVSYRSYTTGSELEELFEEIDGWLAEEDGQVDSALSMDSE